MAKAKKVLAAVGEPDVLPAPAPAPIQPEADLPWLDCNGNTLLEGDKAHVLPDISKRLSGKLVTIVGNYDAQSRSIEVEVHDDEPNLNNPRILPCYLKLLAVLGDNVGAPTAVDKVSVSPEAQEVLENIMLVGGETRPHDFQSAASKATVDELVAAGLVEPMGSEEPLTYRATAAGIAAVPEEDISALESFEPAPMPAPATKPAVKAAPVTLSLVGEMADAYKVGLRLVPLASIVVTTNTRKVFDETALAELAESVKAHGILQPIVLRPHLTEEHRYELVAGGRRYRAAQLAGLAEVPATVRNLTDREFLEVQLLENLQRVDVRPADEATAFAQLLKSGFPSEEIAQKVGKPVKFVLQRAKLASLMPFWLDALEEGRLPIVAANEIARLPDESQAHLESLALKDYNYKQPGALFSAGWIKGAISQHVLRELNAAAFPKHDAQLCPAAGACTTCPKRSGAFKQLFDEQELKHDYCLDGTCFETKKAAFVTRRQKELTKEQGKPVVRLASSGWNVPPGAVSSYSWSEVAPDKPGAVQALVIDGPEAGQTKWVSLPAEKEKSAEKKADRSAEIRKEKIGEQHRQLLAAHLYTQSLNSNRVSEAHLDNQIYGELRSQGGPHTPLRLALVTYFGWEMPEGGEKALRKLTPASDYQGLRTWEQQNVARLSYDEKLALYFALLGYQCSTFDSSNERLIKYAKSVGAPVESLKKKATEVVDAPKATSKKQEATA